MKHQTYLTKTAGKLRSVFLLFLVTVFSLSGMVTANAATIGETGEYALVLQAPDDEWEGCSTANMQPSFGSMWLKGKPR